jgi:DNA repair exonuclease SbcCD ATPase subunit
MIELPCSDSTLPSKADFVNLFNQIAEIPTELQLQVEQYKTQIESKVNDAEKKLKGLSLEEIEKGIDEEIGKAELQVIEEIESKIEELEDIMEGIADLLSPYWKKGRIRDWEKEAEDAIEELIQEFHIFIPVKIMELINKIIPISFEVDILGLSIDVLKITDPAYQEELVSQISGYTDEYFDKLEQLEADLKSGKLEQDAYDSAKGMLNDEAAKVLDAIYKLVPEELRYYDGEFGLVVNEYKAKLTWKYIKGEIMDWCTMTLFKLFEKLIDLFDEIWDALGLPDLPIPLSLDMGEWIRAMVDLAKEKMDREIQRIEDQAKELEQKAEQLKEDIENFDAQEEISKVKQQMVDEIMNLKVPLPSPFDISLKEILGGDIDKTVVSIEQEIDKLVAAAKEWKTIVMKELLFLWVKVIKKFLDLIGLGKLLDFLTLSFCDVLELLGVPTSFDITLPELPEPTLELSV